MLLHTNIDRDWDTCLASDVKPKRSRCSTLAARWNLISITDYQCILRGRHQLDLVIHQDVASAIALICVRCNQYGHSAKAKQAALSQFYASDTQQDILNLRVDLKAGSDLCNTCQVAVGGYLEKTRETIWEKLPEIFGIKGLDSCKSIHHLDPLLL